MKKLTAIFATLLMLLTVNVHAAPLTGKINIVGLDKVTLDATANTIDFLNDPSVYYTIDATGSFAALSGTTGQAHDVMNILDFTGFLTGDYGFSFDIVSLSVDTADAGGKGIVNFAGGQALSRWHLSNQGGTTSWSATIPTPATLALMGIGLLGLGFAKRKKA